VITSIKKMPTMEEHEVERKADDYEEKELK